MFLKRKEFEVILRNRPTFSIMADSTNSNPSQKASPLPPRAGAQRYPPPPRPVPQKVNSSPSDVNPQPASTIPAVETSQQKPPPQRHGPSPPHTPQPPPQTRVERNSSATAQQSSTYSNPPAQDPNPHSVSIASPPQVSQARLVISPDQVRPAKDFNRVAEALVSPPQKTKPSIPYPEAESDEPWRHVTRGRSPIASTIQISELSEQTAIGTKEEKTSAFTQDDTINQPLTKEGSTDGFSAASSELFQKLQQRIQSLELAFSILQDDRMLEEEQRKEDLARLSKYPPITHDELDKVRSQRHSMVTWTINDFRESLCRFLKGRREGTELGKHIALSGPFSLLGVKFNGMELVIPSVAFERLQILEQSARKEKTLPIPGNLGLDILGPESLIMSCSLLVGGERGSKPRSRTYNDITFVPYASGLGIAHFSNIGLMNDVWDKVIDMMTIQLTITSLSLPQIISPSLSTDYGTPHLARPTSVVDKNRVVEWRITNLFDPNLIDTASAVPLFSPTFVSPGGLGASRIILKWTDQAEGGSADPSRNGKNRPTLNAVLGVWLQCDGVRTLERARQPVVDIIFAVGEHGEKRLSRRVTGELGECFEIGVPDFAPSAAVYTRQVKLVDKSGSAGSDFSSPSILITLEFVHVAISNSKTVSIFPVL